ncbi:hypothetical protein [Rhodoferax saidenbachensis]|uniref:Lipoprotein n=1 Tax=Rhodoferax saidenbachensis TaxID=1484693 RepID=A0ABU1ZHK5_9BURK|nr:hypothetical protein [Rhodoferax saidenbachensis]MDR7305008.1 hypothetical protein [Rhodoferax saidenbachensis]
MTLRPLLLTFVFLLSGCDLETLLADPRVAQREADAKAIGGACRHGLRSLEDCYAMNEKASKAAVFAGWKDMDQYMRDNKIEGVAPKGLKPVGTEEEVITEPKDEKPADDGKAKPKAKPAAKTADKAAAH